MRTKGQPIGRPTQALNSAFVYVRYLIHFLKSGFTAVGLRLVKNNYIPSSLSRLSLNLN